jgi:hypothetical protein
MSAVQREETCALLQVTEMNLLTSRHYAAEGRCFVIAVGALLRRRDLALADESVLPADLDALLLDGGTSIIGGRPLIRIFLIWQPFCPCQR